MANVFFKRGTQDALKTATYVDGAFYLTTDTHRLYVGEGGAIVPVNEGLITVASVSALPTADQSIAGHFYYATAENVLCVFNGTKWVQINPDTYVSGFSSAASVSNKVATVAQTIKQSGQNDDDVKGGFKLAVADLDIAASGDQVTITGDKNDISVAQNGDNVAKVTLGSTLFEDDSVNIKGTSGITVSVSGDDITIGTDAIGSVNDDIAATGHTFTFNGTTGQLDLKLKTKGGDTITVGNVKPIISYGDGDTAIFNGGTATLDVYSKAQIDDQFKTKLNSLNAMTYKGAITALPTSGVSNGNVYLVGSGASISVGGVAAKAGDLVIAEGTETDNIISGTINWTLIPSANEIDTLYTIKASGNKINLDSTGDNSSISVEGDGTNITLTTANNKLTATHVGPGTGSAVATDKTGAAVTQSTGESKTITVVDGVEADATGHITKVVTKDVTVYDTNVDEVKEVFSAAKSNNVVTVSHTTTVCQNSGDDETSTAASFSLTSDNLTVSNSGTAVTMNFEWGTF